jgi:hypothetical protein
MSQNYPDNESFAYTLASAEITVNRTIKSSIIGVQIDQPTEQGFIAGAGSVGPIKRTIGTMGLGEGTLRFSDVGELSDFMQELGNGWREKIWGLTYVLQNKRTKKTIKIECISCCLTSEPVDHEYGSDGLGGDINFSFMSHKRDGNSPHSS